jgi:hypothetical protein
MISFEIEAERQARERKKPAELMDRAAEYRRNVGF